MTTTKIEDGTEAVSGFLKTERGVVDGGYVHEDLLDQMASDEQAYDFVSDRGRLDTRGLYTLLGPRDGLGRIGEVNTNLAGRIVIAPIPEGNRLVLYPAVVSIDGKNEPGSLKLHVVKDPFSTAGLTEDQRTLLSAAAQADTKTVGQHGRTSKDSYEAEHFITVMRAALSPTATEQWQLGHPNHQWRQTSSVLDVVSTATNNTPALLDDIAVDTISFKGGILPPGFELFWHESLAVDKTIEAGDQKGALVAIQGLGYLAVVESGNKSDLQALML